MWWASSPGATPLSGSSTRSLAELTDEWGRTAPLHGNAGRPPLVGRNQNGNGILRVMLSYTFTGAATHWALSGHPTANKANIARTIGWSRIGYEGSVDLIKVAGEMGGARLAEAP
jgi:hypothetical protein